MLTYIRKVADTKKANNDEGASAVEYGLLIAGIAAVLIGVVFGIGLVVNGNYGKTSSCLDQGTASTC